MNVSTLITLISPVPRVPDNFLPKDLNRPPLSASNLIVTTRTNAGLSGADMHTYALTVKAVTQEAVAPLRRQSNQNRPRAKSPPPGR